MYWRDIGYLCKEIKSVDKFNREQNAGFEKNEVICDTGGVKRSEFYSAQSAGYRPTLSVKVKEYDYKKESHFEFDGEMYRIIRAFPVGGENIELTCEGVK